MLWLRALPDLLAHEDVVLVTVAQTRGSVPREAGTSMLVTLTSTADTIGGGHLEWEAMAHARAMLLQAHAAPALQRLSLGASLGQCCGGVVWLVFERVGSAQRDVWAAQAKLIDEGASSTRKLSASDEASCWNVFSADSSQPEAGASLETYASPSPGCELSEEALSARGHDAAPKRWQLTHHLTPPHFNLTIFGAGHVGAAIVSIAAMLDARIRWVDVRDDLFGAPSANVSCIATDAPEDEVDNAPSGSFFLVLTHSHALDLLLTERILRRDDFAWFGLIGSRTKRARFEHRLHAQGIDATSTARMTCPIGIAGIHDKTPHAIAVAVVAQLLQARESQDARGQRKRAYEC
jgi:xanthine dehydrogenase accessory factor